MASIGELCRRFDLARSTLLYYERIALLVPSGRSAANYRRYSKEDLSRLERICAYRELGLELKAISELLDGGEDRFQQVLETRLQGLQQEIRRCRQQQQVILRLLQARSETRQSVLDKRGWTELLRATGLSDEDMYRWHREFERRSPEAHREFLISLGIDDQEVARIRAWSKTGGDLSPSPI